MADSGWVLCTAAQDLNDVASVGWGSVNNILTSNDVYANWSASPAKNADTLKAFTFGLAIPSGATIVGVETRVEAKATAGSVTIGSVRIGKSDAVLGTAKTPGDTLTGSDANYDHGGAADLWGLTLSEAEVEASTFQIRYVFAMGASSTVNVDAVWVKVYYDNVSQTAVASTTTDGATATFTAQAIGANGGSDVIYIGAGCRSVANASTMGCTVDGVSADQIVFRSFDEGAGVRSNCAMFAISRNDLPDPAQTDVDVVLTHNQVAIRHAIALAVSPNASKTAFATASQANASNDLSLNTPADGIAIGFMYNGEISTITWTGLTEVSDIDVAAEGGNRFGTAYESTVAAETPRTITAATGVDLSAKVAASFALAADAVARFVGTNLTASRFLNPRSLVKH